MTTVETITLSIAVLGAIFGIISTWHNFDKTRVKLVVRPKHAIPFGGVNPTLTFCIEVTNLSFFAVTISEVGVLFHGTKARGVIPPILLDKGNWPRRLEPRMSVTVYAQNPAVNFQRSIRCAYATTECGVTRRATSPALKQIAERSSP